MKFVLKLSGTVFYESPSLGKFVSNDLILCLRTLLTIQCLLDPEMEALKFCDSTSGTIFLNANLTLA